jgi:hypothetical protein
MVGNAAVTHPPGWDPGASTMALAAVRTYPGRFAIMGPAICAWWGWDRLT